MWISCVEPENGKYSECVSNPDLMCLMWLRCRLLLHTESRFSRAIYSWSLSLLLLLLLPLLSSSFALFLSASPVIFVAKHLCTKHYLDFCFCRGFDCRWSINKKTPKLLCDVSLFRSFVCSNRRQATLSLVYFILCSGAPSQYTRTSHGKRAESSHNIYA